MVVPSTRKIWDGGPATEAAAGPSSCLPRRSVLGADRRRLPQGRHPLAAVEQRRGLGGSDRPSRRDRDGDGGHRDVVRGLHDRRDVVLAVRVAAGHYPGSDGFSELLAHDLQAILGVLDLRGQRLRSVGDLVQVLWHCFPPSSTSGLCSFYDPAPSTILRPPPTRAPARTDWWIPIAWGRRRTRAGAWASPPRRRPASALRFLPWSSRPPRTRP